MRSKWYFIGLLWALGSISEDKYLFRHKQSAILDEVVEYLSPDKLRRKQEDYRYFPIRTAEGKAYYQFKVFINHPLIAEINELGFTGRGDADRKPPEVPREHLGDFLIGYARAQHWSYEPARRIRLYGNEKLLELYNRYISETLGRKLMKLQKHNQNDSMKVLYYQGKTIDDIAEHLKLLEG